MQVRLQRLLDVPPLSRGVLQVPMNRMTAEDLDRAIMPGPYRDTGSFSSHTDGPLAPQEGRYAGYIADLNATTSVMADGRVIHDLIVDEKARMPRGTSRTEVLRSWNARHAKGGHRFAPASIPSNAWVPDRKAPGGYREIDLLRITVPHDCANHLPEDSE